MSAVSQVQAAKANARAAGAEAESIDVQTKIAQDQERYKNRDLLSRQLAVSGASGVETTSGSPLSLALESAYQGEMNVLNIGYTGQQRSAAKRYEKSVYQAQVPGIITGGVLNSISAGLSAYKGMGGGFGGSPSSGPQGAGGAGSQGGGLINSWAQNNYGGYSNYGISAYDPRRYRLE
jgi:hypothetical protein